MTNNYTYFVANWKMFGLNSSLKIIKKVISYLKKSKNKKNKVIFCVPYTLLNSFSKKVKSSNVSLGAQNCHHLNDYGAYTGSVNSKMIKDAGAKYVIIGHSENRFNGDDDNIINKKILSSLKNNLKIIFCIGETLIQKRKKITNKILTKQIFTGLKNVNNVNNIIIAYEPVWSIGTGIIPSQKELLNNILLIKKILKKKYSKKYSKLKILYGGSVNPKNIKNLNKSYSINGYLVGGASQLPNKFIDIIKKSYM
tara:strand:+ start:72 stop:830 length:759 start_codon:yes stop_codon:yes gene_type:complete